LAITDASPKTTHATPGKELLYFNLRAVVDPESTRQVQLTSTADATIHLDEDGGWTTSAEGPVRDHIGFGIIGQNYSHGQQQVLQGKPEG
jgi:hypothetical protein